MIFIYIAPVLAREIEIKNNEIDREKCISPAIVEAVSELKSLEY